MALMNRLRRVEAGIEWLETEGALRLCATKIKWLQMKEQVEARLAREPGHEGARTLAPYLGIKLPPLPKPVVPPPPPAPAPSPPPPAAAKPHPEEPGAARRLEGCATGVVRAPIKARGLPRADRDAVLRTAPQDEVVRAPPPPEPGR